ncbi:hypothetical protein [Massilia sp. YIM B02443]|uniref:hypothetical protein n=1 Tax=Massilia sp. YIM B02443 TaxID=3050127 RepID=UPI0025B679FC|nr:hypothetical protein [Massilia sp. YIM B02443]MDN4037555.1 hypothetical protein [Massilia sp. YIM B02443]
MKNTLSTLGRMVLVLIAAITLTLLSVRIERIGPDLIQYGNVCGPAGMDPCYKPALKGGFPVPYLVDAPGISVQRQLAFFEDNLHPWALTADIALYFAILMSIVWAVRRRRSK